MQLEPKKHVLIVVIIWIVSLAISLSWNLIQLKKTSETEWLKTSRAFVQQILVTRTWNAMHSGVYLRVSDSIRPNPFLPTPGRDIETSEGLQLTLVNPAFTMAIRLVIVV